MFAKHTPEHYYDTFKDTEDFLATLDPKKYDPPFMTTIFTAMRKEAYDSIQKDCSKLESAKKKEIILFFIEKFELEYVEVLRSKLRERYIDFILQKKYEIPSEVNMKEIESFGAISEIAQLAIAIAEWTLELEINAYTLEGLRMYGLLKGSKNEHKDYLSALKKEYNYQKQGSIISAFGYVVRKALTFTFSKIGHIALAKGMATGGIEGKDILEIIFNIVSSGNIPWKVITNSMNLTWIVGGYVCSHFMESLNDYTVRRDTLTHLAEVQASFETNKLHLMTERRTLLDLVEKTMDEEDDEKYEWELDVLKKTVENILEPKKHAGAKKECEMIAIHHEHNKKFNVTEEEDCIVVEEKEFKEKVDESGVVVVDW